MRVLWHDTQPSRWVVRLTGPANAMDIVLRSDDTAASLTTATATDASSGLIEEDGADRNSNQTTRPVVPQWGPLHTTITWSEWDIMR